jgi:glyoxylase-like metal-dependent hydrolase (beta-lactamase superfamily II)
MPCSFLEKMRLGDAFKWGFFVLLFSLITDGISVSKIEAEPYEPKEIFPSLYKLRIPLPMPSLRYLNSYLIKAKDQCLLIDTGMYSDAAFSELRRQLAEIKIQPQKLTEILVTHFHIDHVGLIPRLRKLSGAKLLVSAEESQATRMMASGNNLERLVRFYEDAGIPAEVLGQMLGASPSNLYSEVYEELCDPSRPLRDGDEISIGEYSFRVLWTPGHSPGHICLYEHERRLLIAGDHILSSITPNITQWGEGNSLAEYLTSLEKVGKLNVDAVLPGHGETFADHRKRIKELLDHHRSRALEILSQLQRRRLTAYQTASRIHWDVNLPSWDRFPAFQKFLAVGETLAHLKFLEEQGKVRKVTEKKALLYSVV